MRLYIFDLDGTIANIKHRLHFIQKDPKDWDGFFEACKDDIPNGWIVDIMRILDRVAWVNQIVILSGRSDRVMGLTRAWLQLHRVPHHDLLMRKDGDHRHDEIVKKEMLDEFLKMNPNDIVDFIVDDRQRVVDMWRREGYNVLQCDSWEEI
jgi:hypothetical protein